MWPDQQKATPISLPDDFTSRLYTEKKHNKVGSLFIMIIVSFVQIIKY